MTRRPRIAIIVMIPLTAAVALALVMHPRPLTAVMSIVSVAMLAMLPLLVRRIPTSIPLSPFAARWRIGIDYFERIGATQSAQHAGTGLVDSLADLARPGMDVGDLDPALHAFFTRTGSFELMTRPHWHLAWRPLRPLIRILCRAIGQFDIPARDAWIDTRIFALDARSDPRAQLRGVIRTYAGTERPMQVAAYGVHRLSGAGYMNCAFPLPGGNLTGILRLDRIESANGRAAGLSLSSHPAGAEIEDTGVWYVTTRTRTRLPLDEILSFWPAGAQPFAIPVDLAAELGRNAAQLTVIGSHVMRLFGIPFVSSQYFIRPSSKSGRQETAPDTMSSSPTVQRPQ